MRANQVKRGWILRIFLGVAFTLCSASLSEVKAGWFSRNVWSPGDGLFGKRQCCPSTLQGEEAPEWHPWRIREWPGKAFQGRGNRVHNFERAGFPNEVSRRARPTETPNYIGYYVGGGGSAINGAAPGPLQGTFGYDYAGVFCRCRKLIVQGWGKRWQGGVGYYGDEGPYPYDVVPAIVELKHTPTPGKPLGGEGEGEGGH